MIKMYVMQTCPYCEYVERQAAGDDRFEIIDIGQDVRRMKEFLHLRDTHPAFAEARSEGAVGIPCYVLEDGSVTLTSLDVGLQPLTDAPTCSLGGGGC